MHRAICKAALAVLTLLAVNTVLDLTVIPPLWGNPYIAMKIEEMKKRPHDFNAVILGTSRVANHIDPALLSGITLHGETLRFMNMGIGAMLDEEELFILRTMLKEDIRPKLILAEALPVRRYEDFQRGTARTRYFLTWPAMMRIAHGIRATNYEGRWKEQLGEYGWNYLKRITHAYLVGEMIQERKYVTEEYVLGPARDGFFSKDWYPEDFAEEQQRIAYKASRPDVFNHFAEEMKRIELTTCDAAQTESVSGAMREMLKTAQVYDIPILFFSELPNRSPAATCVLHSMPKELQVAPITTDEAPSLFVSDAYIDLFHLHLKQARFYSQFFAKKVRTAVSRLEATSRP